MTKKSKKTPKLHEDLKGFDITVNSLGQIKSTMDLDSINEFLNKNVDDKKLAEREDFEELTGKAEEEKVFRKKTTRKK